MITGEGVGLFCQNKNKFFPYTKVFISEYRNSSGLDNSGGIYELLQVKKKNLYKKVYMYTVPTAFLYSTTFDILFHKKSKFIGIKHEKKNSPDHVLD
jgi:hypothetical protein